MVLIVVMEGVEMSEQGESDSKKSLSGLPLFIIRLVVCLILVGAAYGIFITVLEFEAHQPWLLIILLPLGWFGAMVISAWFVGMFFYDKEDTSEGE